MRSEIVKVCFDWYKQNPLSRTWFTNFAFSVCYKFDDVREQFGQAQAISELLCSSVSKRVVVENFSSVIELDVELDVDSVSTRGNGNSEID